MNDDLPRPPRHHGSVLMAAMIGIADALGMDQHEDIPEIHAESPADPGLDLDWGGLDPLG